MRWAWLSAALVVLLAAPAAGAPEDDFQAVKADYSGDGDVTACRFTRGQLMNALDVASRDPQFDTYTPGFRDEVRSEIARWDAGGCKVAGAKPAPKPVAKLKIVKVRPRGGLRESVTVKNLGRRTAKLRGVALKDRAGNRVPLGRARLGPGRSLRVFTGCAKGKRRFIRLRSRVYACKKKVVWNDSGDIVRLVNGAGTVLSRVGFGRYKSIIGF